MSKFSSTNPYIPPMINMDNMLKNIIDYQNLYTNIPKEKSIENIIYSYQHTAERCLARNHTHMEFDPYELLMLLEHIRRLEYEINQIYIERL